MSLSVSASRRDLVLGSAVPAAGSARRAVTASARRRSASTGPQGSGGEARSRREQVASRASGRKIEELVPQVVERLGTRGERPRDDRDPTVASGTERALATRLRPPMELEPLIQPQATCARGEQSAPIEHGR